MDAGERRKWQRLGYDLRVQLHILGTGGGRSVSAIGTHLSPEGIFVQLADPPPPDSRVRVCIGTGDAESIQLQAEGVVINQFVPDDARDLSGVGIALAEAGAPWRKLYEWLSQGSADS